MGKAPGHLGEQERVGGVPQRCRLPCCEILPFPGKIFCTFLVPVRTGCDHLNNPKFNPIEFDRFRSEVGLNGFAISPRKWVEATHAK